MLRHFWEFMENAEKEYIEEKQKQGNSSKENVEW